jgi:hypothetical protein
MSIDFILESDLLFTSILLILGLVGSRLTLDVDMIVLVAWLSSFTDTEGRETSRFSDGDELESLVMGLAGRRVGVIGAWSPRFRSWPSRNERLIKSRCLEVPDRWLLGALLEEEEVSHEDLLVSDDTTVAVVAEGRQMEEQLERLTALLKRRCGGATFEQPSSCSIAEEDFLDLLFELDLGLSSL